MERAIRALFSCSFIVGSYKVRVTKLGGKWNNGANCSTWYLNLNNTSSNRNRNIGSHLLYVHLYQKQHGFNRDVSASEN